MDQTTDEVLSRFLEKVDRYKAYSDVSLINSLIMRYIRTVDLSTKIFLAKRISSELDKLRRRFPAAELINNNQSIKEINGDIKIGDLVLEGSEPLPFFIKKSDINKNILIIASVGHGKTTLIQNILTQLNKKDITYLVFDMKRDYRTLAGEENTIHLDESNLRINPLSPPAGISRKEWAVHLVDAFSHNFSLLIGSRDFLLDSILNFYNEWNNNLDPTLRDFLYFLEKSKLRNEYINVVKGRIKGLLSSTNIFDCASGLDLSKVDKYNLVFGIDKFGLAEQGFIVSFVLSYLFHLNMNDSNKRNRLYKTVVIDDAHTILDSNREKDYAMGISLLHMIISKMRELGVGFIFADQQLSSLLSSAIQNTNLKFIGRVNLIGDLNLLLDRNSAEEVGDKTRFLNSGEFFVLSDKIYPYGIVRADKVNINKDIDDSVLLLNHYRFRTLSGWGDWKDNSQNLKIEFLKEIAERPNMNISKHLQNLKWIMTETQSTSVKRELLSKGIIKEIKLKITPDYPSKFLFMDSESAEVAEKELGFKFKPLQKTDLLKKIIKDATISILKKRSVAFSGDDSGLLLKGLRKIYIVFMDDGNALSKILETKFDLVIDIIDDEMSEKDIYSRLLLISKPEALANISVLRIKHLYDFNLN